MGPSGAGVCRTGDPARMAPADGRLFAAQARAPSRCVAAGFVRRPWIRRCLASKAAQPAAKQIPAGTDEP
jgi:hypothetical protein